MDNPNASYLGIDTTYLDNLPPPVTIKRFWSGLCPDTYEVVVLSFRAHQRIEVKFRVIVNFERSGKGKDMCKRSILVAHSNGYRQHFDMPNGMTRQTVKKDILSVFKRMYKDGELWQYPRETPAASKYPNCSFFQQTD